MNGWRIGGVVVLLAMGSLLWSGCSKKTKTAPSEQGQAATQPVFKVTTHRAAPTQRAATIPAAAAPTQPATATAPASEPATAPVSAAPPVQPPEPYTPEMAKMQDQFGLTVLTVTTKEKAIEVVFQVYTPEKAGQILSPDAQRYLVDEKSGTRLTVSSATARPGRERRRTMSIRPVIGSNSGQRGYVVTFDNSQGLVQPGDKVSLIMDEYHVDDLTVR